MAHFADIHMGLTEQLSALGFTVFPAGHDVPHEKDKCVLAPVDWNLDYTAIDGSGQIVHTYELDFRITDRAWEQIFFDLSTKLRTLTPIRGTVYTRIVSANVSNIEAFTPDLTKDFSFIIQILSKDGR